MSDEEGHTFFKNLLVTVAEKTSSGKAVFPDCFPGINGYSRGATRRVVSEFRFIETIGYAPARFKRLDHLVHDGVPAGLRAQRQKNFPASLLRRSGPLA